MPGRYIPGLSEWGCVIVSIRLNPHIKFTPEDVRLIEQRDGALSALEWLALVPPDRFDGDWQKVYDELEHRIYWGLDNGV